MERRKFIKNSALAGASAVAGTTALSLLRLLKENNG